MKKQKPPQRCGGFFFGQYHVDERAMESSQGLMYSVTARFRLQLPSDNPETDNMKENYTN